MVFRIGGDDAKKLESEMTPVFKAKDMINLGMQEFYIKMTIDGNTYDPFSAETLKIMPATHKSFKEEIIKHSREKYAIHIDEVKRKLEEEEKELLFGKRGAKKAESAGGGAPSIETKTESGPPPMV